MSTLWEYFVKDGASNLTMAENWEMKDEVGKVIGQVTARLHFDFEAFVLGQIPHLLMAPTECRLVEKWMAGERTNAKDLPFTGQVYVYSERAVDAEHQSQLVKQAVATGHRLVFRSVESSYSTPFRLGIA